MSTPRTSQSAAIHEAAAISHEKLAVAVAQNEERAKGLGEDLHDLGKRVGNLESEVRRGFSDVASQVASVANEFRQQTSRLEMEATRLAAPKGIQWPMVAVFCSVSFALAAWAASYFGKDIASLARERQADSERMTVISDRVYQQSLTGAAAGAAQARDAYWIERQNERLESEIDKLRQQRKPEGP